MINEPMVKWLLTADRNQDYIRGNVMDKITVEHTLQMAMNCCNEEMDTHYSMINVKHEYFNPENVAEVYERFCS